MTPSLPTSPLPRLQDLPPAWARFCLGIERFLLQDAWVDIRGRNLLLACSAGSDSLALLLVMHSLASRLKTRLHVAHLDHGLRPESAPEAQYLGKVCEKLEITSTIGRANVGLFARKIGLGIEEAGRTLRYRFVLGLRKKIGADLVLTAHHADDLAEDVLMRLIRGAGWPGLSGMPAWDPVRRLARPLLHTPKNTLQDFLRALGLAWREDAGNADQDFLRNRIRLKVMPELQRENPHIHRGIAQVQSLGMLDHDYFATLLSPLTAKAQAQGHFLDRTDLDGLHPALRLRLFKAMLDLLGPGQVLYGSLRRLDAAWQEKRTGATIQFPSGKQASITKAGIRLEKTCRLAKPLSRQKPHP